MSSLQPLAPKPGYQVRWFLQALALLPRSPLALATLVGGVLAAGTIGDLSAWGFAAAGLSDQVAFRSGELITGLALFPAVFLVSALFFRADRGDGPGFPEIGAALAASTPRFITAGLLTTALLMMIDPSTSASSLVQTASAHIDTPSLPFFLVAGQDGISTLFLILFWTNILHIPLQMRLGLSFQESRQFHDLLVRKLGSVYLFVALTSLLVAMVIDMVPLIGLVIFHLHIAWSYVAIRELTGGPRENGREEVACKAGLRPGSADTA